MSFLVVVLPLKRSGGIVWHFFKECDISGDKYFFGLGTVAPVPFLGWRIAKKDGFYGLRVKFGSVLGVKMNKGGASKCLEGKIIYGLKVWICFGKQGQLGIEV